MRRWWRTARYFKAFASVALSIVIFAQTSARATSFYERPFSETVKDAPVIVRGTTGNTYTDWGHERDGGKRIFTYWELRVSEVLKGTAEGDKSLLRMREMGGEKDGVGMQVAGTATFGSGEDVVVFLGEKNSEGSYDVWGMTMGKYNIKKDADGQEILSGAGLFTHSKSHIYDGDEGQADTRGASKWTLDALRHLVASQGDAPASTSLNPSKKTTPGPTETASSAPPVPAPTHTVTERAAAPQLQPSASEESSFPIGLVVAIGAAVLGILWYLFARKR